MAATAQPRRVCRRGLALERRRDFSDGEFSNQDPAPASEQLQRSLDAVRVRPTLRAVTVPPCEESLAHPSVQLTHLS